jgi:hypothetical protein
MTEPATKLPTGRTEVHEPQRRFELVPFDEIKLATGRNYLVKGLIPREGLVVVWGPPKCGKSFWTYDVAMHIALGWEYRGRRVDQGPVVYLACEGERGLGARTEAFRQSNLSETAEGVPFFLATTRLDLAKEHEELTRDIQAQIGETAPVAVVIDTLNRSINGSESNDADMGAYVKGCDAVREAFGCSVIVIHHCGISNDRPRGHTSLTGAADAQIAVKRDSSGTIVTEVEHMKDGAEGEQTFSKLEVVEVDTDEDGDVITSCVIEPTDGTEAAERLNKVSGKAKLALDLLRKALVDDGQPAPASNHIPGHLTVVRVDIWRRFYIAGNASDKDKPDTVSRAFRRAVDKLQDLEVIGVWDDYVWICE